MAGGSASKKEIPIQRRFIGDFKIPSVHIKKARVWSLRQFFHFLKLNGWVGENIALDLPYPKIEKTVPKYLTIDEYNRILRYFYENAINSIGLRNLVLIMILSILRLRLGSVISLNVDDIDLETRLICFTDKGKKKECSLCRESCVLFFHNTWSYTIRSRGRCFCP
jgi:integrase/recombinase XerC